MEYENESLKDNRVGNMVDSGPIKMVMSDHLKKMLEQPKEDNQPGTLIEIALDCNGSTWQYFDLVADKNGFCNREDIDLHYRRSGWFSWFWEFLGYDQIEYVDHIILRVPFNKVLPMRSGDSVTINAGQFSIRGSKEFNG